MGIKFLHSYASWLFRQNSSTWTNIIIINKFIFLCLIWLQQFTLFASLSQSLGGDNLFIRTSVFILQSRALHCTFFRLWGLTCVLHGLYDTQTTNILWTGSIIFSVYELYFQHLNPTCLACKMHWSNISNKVKIKDFLENFSLWFIFWGSNQCLILFGLLYTEKLNYLIPTPFLFSPKVAIIFMTSHSFLTNLVYIYCGNFP